MRFLPSLVSRLVKNLSTLVICAQTGCCEQVIPASFYFREFVTLLVTRADFLPPSRSMTSISSRRGHH